MPNEFPRSKGPWVDTGAPVSTPQPCPNCGSNKYVQTVSTESCSACGYRFDYWGKGGNEVYNQHAERVRRRQEEADAYRDDVD